MTTGRVSFAASAAPIAAASSSSAATAAVDDDNNNNDNEMSDRERSLQQNENMIRRSTMILDITASVKSVEDFDLIGEEEEEHERELLIDEEIKRRVQEKSFMNNATNIQEREDKLRHKRQEQHQGSTAAAANDDTGKSADSGCWKAQKSSRDDTGRSKASTTCTIDDTGKSGNTNSSQQSSNVGAVAVAGPKDGSVRPAYDSGIFEVGNDRDFELPHGDIEAGADSAPEEEATATAAALSAFNGTNGQGGGAVQAKAIDEQELEDELKERIFSQVVEAKEVVVKQENDDDDDCSPTKRTKRWFVLILLVVIVTVIIVGAVVGSKSSSSPDSSTPARTTAAPTTQIPTVAPTPAPTLSASQQELLDYLLRNVPSQASQLALGDKSSPQYQAFDWLSQTPNWDGALSSILQRYALATLYFSLNGDQWARTDGWLDPSGADPCTRERETGDGVAFGLTCLNRPSVQELHLSSNGLEGVLPPELQLLSELRILDLSGNRLQGPLDLGLFAKTLQTLWLGSNSFTGTLSPVIGTLTKLRELSLESNPLNGALPTELGNLENLATLDLENNLFVGDIPTQVERLTQLELWSK